MDMDIIQNIISSMGFPIFCTVVLFREISKERAARETNWEKIANAINENTNTLNILCERLRKDDEHETDRYSQIGRSGLYKSRDFENDTAC